MPFYEYQCKICEKVSQKWEPSIKDMKKEIQCECGRTANKIISNSSFKINGFNEKNGYSNSDSK